MSKIKSVAVAALTMGLALGAQAESFYWEIGGDVRTVDDKAGLYNGDMTITCEALGYTKKVTVEWGSFSFSDDIDCEEGENYTFTLTGETATHSYLATSVGTCEELISEVYFDTGTWTEKVVPVKVTVTDVDNADWVAYTNEVPLTGEQPYLVESNTIVKVVYTADEGYEFADGKTTWTTNFTASAATVTVTIPEGEKPTKKEPCEDCLTFTSAGAFSVQLQKCSAFSPTVNLEYSTDKINWLPYVQDKDYDAAKSGDDYVLYLRGTNNTAFATYDEGYEEYCSCTFVISGDAVACSGNIETLLDYTVVAAGEHPQMDAYAFYELFCACTTLTTAPELPATTLAKRCYGSMFYCCTSLTAAPALPTTTLAERCYESMFSWCESLTAAPELPATMLAEGCYYGMFEGCTSLKAVPALPATNLADSCYYYMFYDCWSLVVNEAAPGKAWSIPAEAAESAGAADEWNYGMFESTGGTFKGAPEVGTTYYIRSAVAVIEPGEVTGAKVTEVSTNGTAVATAAPYVVEPNATVTVVYTADEGYEFAGGAATWTTNFTASAATITVTIPEGERPKATTADYTIYLKDGKAYKDKACETEITSDMAAKGLTYAEGAWTMTDFTFTTTTNTALEFLDETATLNVSGENFVTGGGDATERNSYGIDCEAALTIVGGSTADALTVKSGDCRQDSYAINANSLTVNTVTLNAVCGVCSDGLAAGMNVKSLAVNDAVVLASVTGTANEAIGIYGIDSCEVTGTGVVVATGNLLGIMGGSETAPKATAKATGTETVLTWCELGKGYIYMNGKAFAASVTLTEPQPDYLTFTAEEANSSVSFKWWKGSDVMINTNGTWEAYTAGTTIPLAKVGDKVMFKGDGVETGEDADGNICSFAMTGKIAASGDVGTLTDGKGGKDVTLTKWCYYYMFLNCTALTAAPKLPATKLAIDCYYQMFMGCTSLTTAPDLPATTLADDCYFCMFFGCVSLTKIPALPATEVADGCYGAMFYGCVSLVVNEAAPGQAWSIPSEAAESAKTASQWNYYMFAGTGGNVTQPEVGKTYYVRSAVAVIEPSAVEGAKVTEVSTNGYAVATAAPYVVEPNAAVTVVYTADEGYEFADGAATWTTNFTASAATVTVTIPEGERPTKKAVKYLEPVYKTVGEPASGIDHWVTNSVSDYTVVTAETTTWNAGWYVVNADVTIDNAVTTSGDVKLILVDGAKLTVTPPAGDNDAIGSAYGDWDASFTVYGQTNGTGALIATGADNPNNYGGSGISVSAAITINGGTVTTTGGAAYWYGQHGLGTDGGTITISGGNVTANGGSCSYGGSAIDSGYVTIAGGTVTANGGTSSSNSGGSGIAGEQNVTIAGGTVKANGGASGSDYIYDAGGDGIYGYSVSISGGTVTAVGGTGTTKAGDGIFGDEYVTASEDVTVKAGTTSASDVIAHTSEQNIASELAGKRYATAVAKQVTIIDLGDGLKAQVVEGGCTITGDGTGSGVLTDTTALKDKAITNLVVGTGVTGIGEKAFSGWRTLRDVEIGAGCTSVGALAFGKCHNVTNIACAATGTITIGNNAFVGCNSLEALSFETMPTFEGTPFLFLTAIYMKDGIPEVYAMPTVTITGYKQVLKGSNDLQNWENVDTTTPEGKAKYHFFKIVLEAK